MSNQEWAIKNGQSRMGNQEWTIKNGQSSDFKCPNYIIELTI